MLTGGSSRETLSRGWVLERHGDGWGCWDHRSPLSMNFLKVSGFDSLSLSLPQSSRTVVPTFVHACLLLCSHQRNHNTVLCWVLATVRLCFEWEGFNHAGNWTLFLLLHDCFCIGFWNPSVYVLFQKCGGCTVRFVHIIKAVLFSSCGKV